MNTFTIHMVPDDNSKYPVNYFRYVIYDKIADSYFELTKEEDKKFNDSMWKMADPPVMITGNRIESNIGDTIYVVLRYKKVFREVNEIDFIYAYKKDEMIKAIVRALKDFDDDKEDEKLYKVVPLTITKDMVIEVPSATSGGKHSILDLFNQDDTILEAYKNEDGSGIDINPEYAKDPKVKNALLSMKTISKFKL